MHEERRRAARRDVVIDFAHRLYAADLPCRDEHAAIILRHEFHLVANRYGDRFLFYLLQKPLKAMARERAVNAVRVVDDEIRLARRRREFYVVRLRAPHNLRERRFMRRRRELKKAIYAAELEKARKHNHSRRYDENASFVHRNPLEARF